jgi:soluble lytic murein transglycosylase
MARVRELMYWNMDNTARSEWANLVTSRTKSQQAQLARYAFDQHWWDLSVQATIAGKLWDQLEERFPLAYNDLFARYISGKDIRRATRWRLPVRRAPGTRKCARRLAPAA